MIISFCSGEIEAQLPKATQRVSGRARTAPLCLPLDSYPHHSISPPRSSRHQRVLPGTSGLASWNPGISTLSQAHLLPWTTASGPYWAPKPVSAAAPPPPHHHFCPCHSLSPTAWTASSSAWQATPLTIQPLSSPASSPAGLQLTQPDPVGLLKSPEGFTLLSGSPPSPPNTHSSLSGLPSQPWTVFILNQNQEFSSYPPSWTCRHFKGRESVQFP